MPVGVPKVVFQIPEEEEEDPTWVDLYNRLHRERFLFIGQKVDHEIANNIVSLMIFLGIDDPTREQFLFINSPGGWVRPGLSIHDAIKFVPPEVTTVGMGVAASMGCFILNGGEITKRIAYPHARVMIHQPASSFFPEKKAEIFASDTEEVLILRSRVIRSLSAGTGQPFWRTLELIKRDTFMSPTEALEHGIVDLVGVLEDKDWGTPNGWEGEDVKPIPSSTIELFLPKKRERTIFPKKLKDFE